MYSQMKQKEEKILVLPKKQEEKEVTVTVSSTGTPHSKLIEVFRIWSSSQLKIFCDR